MESKSDFEGLYTSALLTAKWGVVAQKRGREPIVRSTLRAIWLLVPDPFSEPREPIVRSTLRAIWLLVPDPFSEPFKCTCESCQICRKVVGGGFSI